MSPRKSKPAKIIPPLTVDPNQDYSMSEAAAIRRECRASTYKIMKAGGLDTFTRGRRRYVSGRELIARAGRPT